MSSPSRNNHAEDADIEAEYRQIVRDIREDHKAYEHAHPIAIILKLFITAGLGVMTIVYLMLLRGSFEDIFSFPSANASVDEKLLFALKCLSAIGASTLHLLNATQAVRVAYPFVSANLERIFINPQKHSASGTREQLAMMLTETVLFFFNSFVRIPMILVWRIAMIPVFILQVATGRVGYNKLGKLMHNWIVSVVSSLEVLFTLFIFVLGVTIIFASETPTDVLVNFAAASIFSSIDDQAVHMFRQYERDIYNKQREYLSDKANRALKWSRQQDLLHPPDYYVTESTTCCGLLPARVERHKDAGEGSRAVQYSAPGMDA
ncbi:Hypothetical Protein FCC1311_047842 [Hondaea fermentalgiana]|uniref:Uncharacterized protein n=1 Tax=Hondaea fermentalgiana TaxID=2315210 RepID=A0A2R5GC33_9STRA|nr:Hypothetical Protein FCC1311_047842 [Hondaea fermentalgiana]|eukprot:GBG28562.1 Hypothetical Protein FCC1311_047842 [Hondaea fermentalgiana]